MRLYIKLSFLCVLSFSIFSCKSENKEITYDEIKKDTLFHEPKEINYQSVYERNSYLLAKYTIQATVNDEAFDYLIQRCLSNIYSYEYTFYSAPNSNKGLPIYKTEQWKFIEPLYLVLLSTVRKRIIEMKNSIAAYRSSKEIKFRIGDVEGAVQDCIILIGLQPEYPYNHSDLANYYFALARKDEACREIRIARDMGAEIKQSMFSMMCD